jgi:hypothetical protein
MSAKLLQVKQLQNELTDAQFQLNVSVATFNWYILFLLSRIFGEIYI